MASSFNMSNLTNSTSSVVSSTPALLLQIQNALNYVDILVRVLAMLVHIVYFLIVFTHRELRSVSLVLMNHINFIGFVSALNFMAWINQTSLSLKDPFWYSFVCTIAELAWIVVRIARAYSILVLSIYRFIAVYHINLYKGMSQSCKWMSLGCAVPWIAGTVIFLISQYISDTTYSPILCTDGYSTSINNVIIYNSISIPLGYFIPIALVVVFFGLVSKKLNQMSQKLGKKNCKTKRHAILTQPSELISQHAKNSAKPSSNVNGVESMNGRPVVNTLKRNSKILSETAFKRKENRAERTLAFQFITLNLLELLSALTLNLIIVYFFVPSLNTNYYYIRQLLRISSNIFLMFIPVISLVFHPFKLKKLF